MGKGDHKQPLPIVSFTRVADDNFTKPLGVADKIIKSYGYNDGSDFDRPDHYIRYIEPLESDLAVQVEYDMDEQDKEWLDAINSERQKLHLDKCSYELFEILMDRFEKEWFDLTKNLPKNPSDIGLPSEDSTCAICDDSEGENSNAIVFCDGCNLAVHQDCYGVPYIPEGQWLCRKCTVSPENPVGCILCPNEGGAFKQTTQGEWVHLLCAIWVPETRVANEVFMEPITGIDKVPKQRWKLKCSICPIKGGASIQCANKSCFIAFHPTCARSEKLLMPMKTHANPNIDSESVTLQAFCDKHLPAEQAAARSTALEALRVKDSDNKTQIISKAARAYAKTYKPGPPLIPSIVLTRIATYTARIKLMAKAEFLTFVARYWSLKREARRGAGLLKRLHLEPWTSNQGGNEGATKVEMNMKLELLKRLRAHLVSIRDMAKRTKEREEYKTQQSEVVQDILLKFFLTHEGPMRMAFENIMGMDKKEFFKTPVLKSEVPDYYEVVKQPLCWNSIDTKLDRHEYWDLQSFKHDIELVISNAILYNKTGTPFQKAALRIRAGAEPILAALLTASHSLSQTEIAGGIGDLEPPFIALETLFSDDPSIQDEPELEYELKEDPLNSIFRYEIGTPKPRPPTPPPPPPSAASLERIAQRAAARDARDAFNSKRREDRRKAKEAREAMSAKIELTLDSSPGFRQPRLTRRAAAASAAFEAEANTSLIPVLGSFRQRRKSMQKSVDIDQTHADKMDNGAEPMNQRDSFLNFNAGWILPEGERRRRPVSPFVPSKERITPGSSNLASSTSILNWTLKADRMLMDVDQAKSRSDKSNGKSRQTEPQQPTYTHSEHGTLIIEEIETPATRREKQRLLRAKRISALERQTQSSVATLARCESSQDGDNDEDDLSSILTPPPDSDIENDGVEEVGQMYQATRTLARPMRMTDRGFFTLPKRGRIPEGTVVWAKQEGFPWWPGVVYDDDSEVVPKKVKANRDKDINIKIKPGGPFHFINFYDKARTWSWFQADKLKMFNEDLELDQDMIAATSSHNRWRPGQRNACRAAYRQAMSELDVEEDPEEPQAETTNPEGEALIPPAPQSVERASG